MTSSVIASLNIHLAELKKSTDIVF